MVSQPNLYTRANATNAWLGEERGKGGKRERRGKKKHQERRTRADSAVNDRRTNEGTGKEGNERKKEKENKKRNAIATRKFRGCVLGARDDVSQDGRPAPRRFLFGGCCRVVHASPGRHARARLIGATISEKIPSGSNDERDAANGREGRTQV